MTAYTVDAVTYDGTVAVLYGHDEAGREVAIAAEPRMARDIDEALTRHERPSVDAEDWQILRGRPDAVRVVPR
jgi:hypothetical protein